MRPTPQENSALAECSCQRCASGSVVLHFQARRKPERNRFSGGVSDLPENCALGSLPRLNYAAFGMTQGRRFRHQPITRCWASSWKT